jgi:hypothetical protein
LGETLPDLASCVSDDGILVGVVVGVTLEDRYPKGPFLEFVSVSLTCLLDNVAEEVRTASTGTKGRALEEPGQLCPDLFHLPRI